MSEIINWLRKPKEKTVAVRVAYDFGTDLKEVEEMINQMDPNDFNEINEFFRHLSEKNELVLLTDDFTLEDLQNAAQTNYEITSAEYKPYGWESEGRFLLLTDTDDDVRCLIMTELPISTLKSVLSRFAWKE